MNSKNYPVNVNGALVDVPVALEKINIKFNENSSLKKRILKTALVITIGTGVIVGAHHLVKNLNETPSTPIVVTAPLTGNETSGYIETVRFDPNSQENLVENAVFLIQDAAKTGKEISPEDAVLYCVVANSDELTPAFIGKLFGEAKDQKYTYGQLVDAYLRVGMMNVENMVLSTNDDLTLNSEEIFANTEDYEYLKSIRTLTTRFNNSIDEAEKKQIVQQLNAIALELCTYDAYDISSSAGVLSMLYLDGMRLITNTNSNNTILPNDIRDEMFGNGDYGCHYEGTYESNGKVLQTQYSYRVNDLKLDSVQAKLHNAVSDDQKAILDDVITAVATKTKDVVIASEVNAVNAVNEQAEENRDIFYEYESSKGQDKPNYTPKTEEDKIKVVNGEEAVVESNNNIATTDVKTKDEAQKEVEDLYVKEQAEANLGAKDGQYYGERGLAKPSLEGKSETYIAAFNISYDAYKKVFDATKTETVEVVSPGNIVMQSTVTDDVNAGYIDGEYYGKNGLNAPYLDNKSEEYKAAFKENYNYYINEYRLQQRKNDNSNISSNQPNNTPKQSNGDTVVSEEIVNLDDLTAEELAEYREALIEMQGKTK